MPMVVMVETKVLLVAPGQVVLPVLLQRLQAHFKQDKETLLLL